ncbi:MAG TPA: hypothetical protein VIS07_10635 [Candidatus Binatia bacterium]
MSTDSRSFSTSAAHTVRFPAARAFLVQFGGEAPLDGRAEHLASGEAIRFDSWTRLQQFVERRLEEDRS